MRQLSTLYVNGNFLTMDRSVPKVQALLVREGRIAALGPHDAVESQAGPNVRRIDLEGRTAVPGLNDCHCHILSFGLTLDQLDMGSESTLSIADIQHAIGKHAERLSDGEWVIGRGYNQNHLEEQRHPSRHDLDVIGQGNPIVIFHTSGHALTCNSRALELAGVTGNTPTPPGGEIERDEHGEPTGVLLEAPAMDLVAGSIPPPTMEQGAEAIIRAMDVMASQGITSASDASTGHGQSLSSELDIYRHALNSGRLAGRITLMPQIMYVAPPDSSEVNSPHEMALGNQDWLQIGPTKIFADGAITTRTAALHEPYADSASNTGLLIWEQDVLDGMIRRAHCSGWQIATHAIGDRAIEVVLDSYERAVADSHRADTRHRIEHCMIVDTSFGPRMQKLGVVAVLQPGFIGRLGEGYIAALGAERASQLMPMELFDWLGIPIAFSSDRPVIPGAPLRGIRSAMQRLTPGGTVLGREHSITALEAIRHFTTGSAYATHTESRKGALRRGMLADFTVFSRDPAETPVDEFSRVRVTMTVVGGVETFTE